MLQQLVDDPSDQLLRILRTNDDFQLKLAALQAAEKSDAPEIAKAEVASAAIDEGLTYSPKNKSESRELKTIRMNALEMLKKYPQPENERLIENLISMLRMYRSERVFDEDEVITLLEALGTFTGEDVARPLSEMLGYYNQRREVAPPDSYRIVRALIQALGDVGHLSGIEELTIVTISDYWENSIQREAQASINKIQAAN